MRRREHAEVPFKCFSTKHMLSKIKFLHSKQNVYSTNNNGVSEERREKDNIDRSESNFEIDVGKEHK